MNNTSGLIISVLFAIFLFFTFYWSGLFLPTEYIEVEHSGFVTDKWIDESMMLSFSNTDYILEINNEFTKEVTHFNYRNIEIGDIYYYTEWEYVE